MDWDNIRERFKLLVNPVLARGEILEDMVEYRRPFDAEVLRQYAAKDFDFRPLDVAELAISHHVNDVALSLINRQKIDLEHKLYTRVEGENTGAGGHTYTRQLTSGEVLLKKAVDSGNLDMIKSLHEMGVPADIQTVEGGGKRMFIFRDLWKAGSRQHIAAVMPVMEQLYPQETARHQGLEATEVARAPGTMKAIVVGANS